MTSPQDILVLNIVVAAVAVLQDAMHAIMWVLGQACFSLAQYTLRPLRPKNCNCSNNYGAIYNTYD